jgi:hypothetical protein
MRDFFAFRKMITPVIIQILFWLGVLGCIIGGAVSILTGGVTLLTGGGLVSGLPVLIGIFWIFVGPILVRIYCEVLILFFRMNDNLTAIRHNTEHKPA